MPGVPEHELLTTQDVIVRYKIHYPSTIARKLIENCLSLKMWILVMFVGISSYLVMQGKMSGDVWATANGTVVPIILGTREIFKIRKIKELNTGEELTNKDILAVDN